MRLPSPLIRGTFIKHLDDLFTRLRAHFGPQHWWPGETPFEVIVGAILTQSAAWTNVEKAIANLKREDLLEPRALDAMPQDKLAALLYPTGYYNSKARKVKAFVRHLGEKHSFSLDSLFSQDVPALREELLSIYGVGEETADSIILYAAGKPSFVIDAYTRRVFHRLGLAPDKDSYAAYQEMFTAGLPLDARLFNEYHALLVQLGKHLCRKQPLCVQCPLRDVCKTGRTASTPKG